MPAQSLLRQDTVQASTDTDNDRHDIIPLSLIVHCPCFVATRLIRHVRRTIFRSSTVLHVRVNKRCCQKNNDDTEDSTFRRRLFVRSRELVHRTSYRGQRKIYQRARSGR